MRTFRILVLLLPFTNPAFSQEILDLLNSANEKAQKGNCIEAISAYDTILSLKPDFSNAYVLKGMCWSMLGNTDSSCICWVDGINLDNAYAKNYFMKYCGDFHPQVNTEDFKTGKFTYLSYIPDTLAYLVRDNEFQTEFSGDSQTFSKYKIKWNDKTGYELKLNETNDSELSFLKKNSSIKIKILKVSGKNCLYFFDFDGMTGFGKMIKM